jgi:bifunctional DNA-binding transcriptional regulator/antitoxin component of YhaV-PrlF toxin-antitoxin module
VIPKEIRRTLRIREGDPQLTVLERESDTQMLLALLAGVIEQRRKYT